MTVLTGQSGVGKTTILKASGHKSVVYMDDVIKNVFYKRNFKLFWDIRETFGKEYTSFFKVNTKKLGKLVFSDPKELKKLNDLVEPYVHTYLEVLRLTNMTTIVEMATYMDHASKYKYHFDKVVLVDRPVNLDGKFDYLDKPKQPIKNKTIKADLVIKDKDIAKAALKLIKFVK